MPSYLKDSDMIQIQNIKPRTKADNTVLLSQEPTPEGSILSTPRPDEKPIASQPSQQSDALDQILNATRRQQEQPPLGIERLATSPIDNRFRDGYFRRSSSIESPWPDTYNKHSSMQDNVESPSDLMQQAADTDDQSPKHQEAPMVEG